MDNAERYSQDFIDRLMKEFLMGAEDAVGQSYWHGSNIVIDVPNLGTESDEHMISLNYYSSDEEIGLVNLRVSAYGLFDYGWPTVTQGVAYDGAGEVIGDTYTFTGGAAGVTSRNAKPNKRLTIVCKLLDPVTITVARNY
jgi:hypothetical protein